MGRLRYNNALGKLGAALTAAGVAITFDSAPAFGTIVAPDYIPLVLEPPSLVPAGAFEVVYLTAYTAGQATGTIARGKEGTAGVAHNNAVPWVHGPVVADLALGYEAAVLSTPGLRFYLPMQDASAQTVLAAAMGRVGGVSANTMPGAAGPPVLGAGSAVAFNGTTQFGSVPLDLSSTKGMTVEFWLNWAAYANNDALAMEYSVNYNTNNGAFIIDPNDSASGKFSASVHGASGYNGAVFNRPSAAAWHHYMFMLDALAPSTSVGVGVCVDGAAVATTQASATPATPTSPFGDTTLYLGSRAGASLFGACSMAHLAVYDRLLTPAHAAAHYAARNNYPV